MTTMRVVVDHMAWLPKSALTPDQQTLVRNACTVYPKESGYEEEGEEPGPILLYRDTPTHLGVPREYFLQRRKPHHDVVLEYTNGALLPSPLVFSGELRPYQVPAVETVLEYFKDPYHTGGLIQGSPAFGKTVVALYLAARLQVPTLVTVHKEFLVDQWLERVAKFLPGARVGRIQADVCEYAGCHIVLSMVHSLAGKSYPAPLYKYFGLHINDEAHRSGAATWSRPLGHFHSRYRLALTATPRRKDGCEEVFWKQVGPLIYKSTEARLTPKVKRVYSGFRLIRTERFNPNLVGPSTLVNFLARHRERTAGVAHQAVKALWAGRKVLVLSHRLEHLHKIEEAARARWAADGYPPGLGIGYYVGGRSKEELKEASEAELILATAQLVTEGLDIPALDTLILATPMSDVEQAVGRTQRETDALSWRWLDGVRRLGPKKEPVVVDFRDDQVQMFRRQGEIRDRFYAALSAAS